MTVKFAKYAFRDLLELLNYSGINEITITKEDNDLILIISDKEFNKKKVPEFIKINAGEQSAIDFVNKYILNTNSSGKATCIDEVK